MNKPCPIGRKSFIKEKMKPTTVSKNVSTINDIAIFTTRASPVSLFIDKLMQRQIMKVANAVITGGVIIDLFIYYDSFDLE